MTEIFVLSEEDAGLIFQDKFSLILLPFLYVAFKRHFVNNHGFVFLPPYDRQIEF